MVSEVRSRKNGWTKPRYDVIHHEWVTISEERQQYGWTRGGELRLDALNDGRHDKPNVKDGDRSNRLGALAEVAAGDHLGIEVPLKTLVFREPDLPHGIEVKMIGDTWWGLRVDPRYPEWRPVMGVQILRGNDARGNAPCPWSVPGWCWVKDGSLVESWLVKRRTTMSSVFATGEFPDVFFYPQQMLRHMDGLRALIDGMSRREVHRRWPRMSNHKPHLIQPPLF